LFAQPAGKIINVPTQSNTVELYKFWGDDLVPVDKTQLNADGSFLFKNNTKLHKGYYKIALKGMKEGINFIFSESEKTIFISAEYKDTGLSLIELKNSPENDAYKILMHETNLYRAAEDSLNRVAELVSKLDSFYYAKKEKLRLQQGILAEGFNSKLKNLKIKHSGTFVADVLCNVLAHPQRTEGSENFNFYDNDRAFNNDHYFDLVDFNDKRILYHPVFNYNLLYYLQSFSGDEAIEFQSSAQNLISKAQNNPDVRNFIVNVMLDYYLSNGVDIMVSHLTETYLNGCYSELSAKTQVRLDNLEYLKIGAKAPDLLLRNTNGELSSLYSACNKNKITLLYFWASWCEHCKIDLPEMVKIYNNHKSSGLEIYAVSLDYFESEWKTTIDKNKMEWINVSELSGWESKSAKLYNIYSTPSVIVLDSNGVILAKNLTGAYLDFKLSELLMN
jgi:peroxiredoxin